MAGQELVSAARQAPQRPAAHCRGLMGVAGSGRGACSCSNCAQKCGHTSEAKVRMWKTTGTRHSLRRRAARRQGRIEHMYLLLAAHPDGAAIQQLTAAGLSHPDNPEPRIVSLSPHGAEGPTTAPNDGTGLAAVVRDLEKRRPRWIWHRTQDWYPSLL